MLGFMNAGTFFMIVVSNFIPSIQIWQFYGFLLVIYLVLMICTFMFITPSVISFSNLQACKHENPIIEELKKVNERLDEIEETIKELHKEV